MPDNNKSRQRKAVKAPRGRPTKYRAKKHIRLLVEVFTQGGSISDFCKVAGVGRSTFYTWCRIDPRFHDAFDLAICHAEVIWGKLPFLCDGVEKINLRTWMCVMRNRFRWGLPKFRARDIRDGTALERMESAHSFFKEGEMSLKEFEKVLARERDLLKEKMEQDLKARQSTPEALKELNPTQTSENEFPASCGDSVALCKNSEALLVLLKSNKGVESLTAH
jgi:hypothetical protein